MAILFAEKAAFFGVLTGHLAAKGVDHPLSCPTLTFNSVIDTINGN
jgi:hypothetical protein